MYALEDAVAEMKALPWMSQVVAAEPLEGLFDGTVRQFRLPVVPADSTATMSFTDKTGTTVTAPATIDHGAGVVRFAAAPTDVVYVTYTALRLSEAALLALARDGFDEMQSRYRRDLYLVSDSGKTVLSSGETTPVDPAVCGDRAFSESRIQVDFYLACCRLRLLQAMAEESTLNAVNMREERVGGLLYDTSRQPRDWQGLLDRQALDVASKESAARAEAGDTEAFGAFLPGPSLNDPDPEWRF